jgi:small subunit ribosomal protein S20
LAGKSAPKKNLSALKKVRQAEKREMRNQSVETKIKTYVGKFETAVSAKNKEEAEKLLKETTKVISSAASKGIIHKNTASRKISRIAKKANAAFSA